MKKLKSKTKLHFSSKMY